MIPSERVAVGAVQADRQAAKGSQQGHHNSNTEASTVASGWHSDTARHLRSSHAHAKCSEASPCCQRSSLPPCRPACPAGAAPTLSPTAAALRATLAQTPRRQSPRRAALRCDAALHPLPLYSTRAVPCRAARAVPRCAATCCVLLCDLGHHLALCCGAASCTPRVLCRTVPCCAVLCSATLRP